MRRRSGFTLTELLVACAILVILAAAILPLTKISVQREKEIELRRSLRIIREAIDDFKKLADDKKIEVDDSTGGYPPDLKTLVDGVKSKSEGKTKKGEEKLVRFLRRIPNDPMTRSTEWGLLSSQDAPDASSWGEQNVFDVYTKSRRKAIDGSNYRDW
jgi:general secretion pathway protein G